jgi:hypothetical protein
MTSPLLGEFLGTMVLILLGDGVVAAVLLKRSKAEGGGWMVIASGWAFAVMAGVFTAIACGSSDAHLNPAVTLGFAVRDSNFTKLLPYLLVIFFVIRSFREPVYLLGIPFLMFFRNCIFFPNGKRSNRFFVDDRT